MKKLVAISFIIFLQVSFVKSQELPTINQFYQNPYFYNPAYAGEAYRPVLFLGYRQQWMGIEGAPKISYLSFHTPLGENLSFGTNLQNDTRGLLNTSKLHLSLGYKVPFTYNHYLRFGISAGAGYQQITDFAELMNDPRYSNDLALLDGVASNLFLDGRFGALYHVNGLNLAFSLPRLLSNKIINETEFSQGELTPLNAYTFLASYKFIFSPNAFAFEPFVIYEKTQSESTSNWEAMGIFHLGSAFWIGGGYRESRSAYGTLGFNIKDKFSLGYGYEMAPGYLAGNTSGTHELQLKFSFGEEKRPQKPKIKEKSVAEEKDPYQEYLENRNQEQQIDLAINPEPETQPNNDASLGDQGEVTDYNGPTTVKRGNHLLELAQGHYVIVNVFTDFEKAEEFSDWLFIQGYFTKYGYSSQSKYYYVYIFYSLADPDGAQKEKSRLSGRELFRKAWILNVE